MSNNTETKAKIICDLLTNDEIVRFRAGDINCVLMSIEVEGAGWYIWAIPEYESHSLQIDNSKMFAVWPNEVSGAMKMGIDMFLANKTL